MNDEIEEGAIMKKVIVIAIVVVLMLAIGVPAAFAFGHGAQHAAVSVQQGYASAAVTAGERLSQKIAGVGEFAAGDIATNDSAAQKAYPGFADADGDGVCDSCDRRYAACSQYMDVNDDGYCDVCGKHHGTCGGYVDSDNDGVCDNQGACGGASASGQAGRHGQAHGHHNGYHHGCK